MGNWCEKLVQLEFPERVWAIDVKAGIGVTPSAFAEMVIVAGPCSGMHSNTWCCRAYLNGSDSRHRNNGCRRATRV